MYQWVRDPIPLDKDSMYGTLFDLSQGVTAVLLMLFRFAQTEAIRSGTESVTENILKEAYEKKLHPLHRILEALRTNDKRLLDKYDDLYLRAFREVEPPESANRLNEMLKQTQKQGAANDELGNKGNMPLTRQKDGGTNENSQQLAEIAVGQMGGIPEEILK
jgi:hypothetical protein